jgi:hypothetical protein
LNSRLSRATTFPGVPAGAIRPQLIRFPSGNRGRANVCCRPNQPLDELGSVRAEGRE